MIPPAVIVASHRQLYPRSCVAWSLELLLKAHDQIPIQSYPLQSPEYVVGYGAKEIQMLRDRGLTVGHWHQPNDFRGLVSLISTNLSQKTCTVFMMPSLVYMNVEAEKLELDSHAFTADWEGGELAFLTWNHQYNKVSRVRQSRMETIHRDWALIAAPIPELRGSLMNCLFASLETPTEGTGQNTAPST
ncbi:MAG: hypothetical protein Q7S40_25290 [Opitutaceae bacterium]|nr:hypothetical protein [Opitutaceae bacterium]